MSMVDTIPGAVIVASGNMSSNVTSAATDCLSFSAVGIQVVWTGTPTGTFDVLASIDGTHYSSLGLSSLPAPAGSGGSGLIPLAYPFPYRYVELKFTRVSGAGSLNAYLVAK